MSGDITRVLGQWALHLHDASVSALAAAVVTLGVVLMMELRSVMRLRHVMDNNLSRVFEQLDLLRFETRQLLEGQQVVSVQVPGQSPVTQSRSTSAPAAATGRESVPTAVAPGPGPARLAPAATPPIAPGALYQNAAAMAASGASSHEIAERLGLATGEARLLSSLAQARARRSEVPSA